MIAQQQNDSQARMAALAVALVAIALVFSGLVSGRAPAFAAQPAAPTPALAQATERPIIIVVTPTPGPERQEAPAVAVEAVPTLEPRIVYVDRAVVVPQPQVDAPADPIYFVGPVRENTPGQATDINDPARNGGNVAPAGCPFPIENGVCGNGQPTPERTQFGSKQKP